jgi:hypothetical protein
MAIYHHEIITIDRGNKEAYLEALRSGWVPYAERTRGMRLLWIGSTIGSTARWPETMALWELRDAGHYAEVCGRMYSESTEDVELKRWWQDAAGLRLRSRSQALVGARFCPSLDELLSRGVTGTVFSFASYRAAPGRTQELLMALERRAKLDEARGRQLVGAYEVMFDANAAYAIWAHATIRDITRYEASLGQDAELAAWSRSVDGVLLESSEFWGFATPTCPLWPAGYRTNTKVW